MTSWLEKKKKKELFSQHFKQLRPLHVAQRSLMVISYFFSLALIYTVNPNNLTKG